MAEVQQGTVRLRITSRFTAYQDGVRLAPRDVKEKGKEKTRKKKKD